jgi:hypothetical protein
MTDAVRLVIRWPDRQMYKIFIHTDGNRRSNCSDPLEAAARARTI